MRSKPVIIVALVIVLIIGFFYFQNNYGKIDKTAALAKVLAPTFMKFGLTDDNLVKKSVELNTIGRRSYYSTYVEYNVPRSFSWLRFDSALRAALKKSGFAVFDVEQSFDRDIEQHTIIIHYGKFDILTFKVNRKGKSTVPAPPIVKAYPRPKIAIVVDDFGNSKNNLDAFMAIKQPITISILPGETYTYEVAVRAKARGFETILHLPMESDRSDVVEETTTIRTGMSEKEILLHLKKEIAEVPGIDGVNNHMGSKATSDIPVMTTVLRYLKSQDLFFLDSLTSKNSVGVEVAKSLGERCAKRDMFLDNSNNTAAIEKQLEDLRNIAFKRGSAIAICHDRKNTVQVLSKVLPEMEREGVEFVRLSELVKK